jgi:DNA-binding XRE family transcriptional regulator
MSDIEKYIQKRKEIDPDFAEDFETGYISFKIGFMLAQARIATGMTQEELARLLNWETSTILKVETEPEDVGILTLERYAEALGKTLFVELK